MNDHTPLAVFTAADIAQAHREDMERAIMAEGSEAVVATLRALADMIEADAMPKRLN